MNKVIAASNGMDAIEELLTRGVEKIYPSKGELEKVLKSGKKLKLYNGIDPTGAHLHLGHMVVLRKLRQFQNLGHETIILIGDFTARIGDPTDKSSTRYRLTKKQVEENSANYEKTIGKLLDLSRSNIRFLHNAKWTNKLTPEDMLDLASNFTVSQLLERDMFQERIKTGKEVFLHEFLYPVFQAYDSVTMDVDLEIGGNDQTFNMLAGRALIKKLKSKEKYVLTTRLLTDQSGKKMGKTEGNLIALDEEPKEMFGKVMAWSDEMIALGLELLTDTPMHEMQTDNILANPMKYKKKLAFEIVKQLNDEKAALNAQESFIKTIQGEELPTDIPIYLQSNPHQNIIDLLVDAKLAESKTSAKRLIEQGGVSVDNKIIKPNEKVVLSDGSILKVGKRKFVKIKIKR